MADASLYPIYEGYWINWSRGRILGATLTLSNSNGTLLVAFLAFFVTIVGTQLWRIFCFATHQIFSQAKPCDALHHQRQAILRNASEPTKGVISLFQVLHAWEKDGKRAYYRILPILIGTIVMACGLALVSGFSAKVVQGNEVLVNGMKCGWLDQTLANLTEQDLYIGPYYSKEQQIDSTYAQQCYSGSFASGLLGCNTFVNKQLPYSTTTNASCPFPGDICVTNDSNIMVDTGYLDSHFDIGINAPESERFKFRLALQCAPLQIKGHTSVHNLSSTRSVTQYYYGESLLYGSNYTIQSSNDAYSEELEIHVMNSDYSINAYSASWNGTDLSGFSSFQPVPELTVLDATLYLVFLQGNGVVSLAPTNDDWFKATTVVGQDLRTKAAGYRQDTPASPMGCVLRHQYCNASGSCTALDDTGGFPDAVKSVFADESAYNRVAWFDEVATVAFDLDPVVHGRNNLNARYGLLGGILDEPLPDNQWQIEVAYWFSIMLASVQKSFVQTAAGSWDSTLLPFITPPALPEETSVCMSQKITSPYFTSFSLFGILFIFILGTIIMILGSTLPQIVSFFQKRQGKDPHARLEWCANDTLQLQRLAHEELGLGTWSHGASSVPKTKADVNLGVLDVSDPKHPRLKSPYSKENNHVLATLSKATTGETLVTEVHVQYVGSKENMPETDAAKVIGNAKNREVQHPEETAVREDSSNRETQDSEIYSLPPR